MISDIFRFENVTVNTSAKSKDDALQMIASFAEERDIVKSAKAYLKGLKKREKEVTTGFKDGIAIPHCKHKTVKQPSLMLVKFHNPIEWEAMDGKPVHLTFALAIPEGKNDDHLKLLSTISRALIDEAFTSQVLASETEQQLYDLINDKLTNMNE